MNLQPFLTRGRSLVEQAIATSGTTVTISRDPDDLDSTVDFDTLAVTDPTPAAPIATGVPALITAVGAPAVPVGPGREEHPTAVRVLLDVTVTDVAEGDRLTVIASRDERFTAQTMLVTAVQDDALGIARHLEARLLP